MSRKLEAGERFPAMHTKNIHGKPIDIPLAEALFIHLQFRRFAGCQICNVHLQTFVQRHDEIKKAGIKEIVVFHSSDESLMPFQGHFSFDVIGDPSKELYHRYGVGTSLLAPLGALAAT